jgi:co-chaperonin GroES (HSP10)
MSDTEYPQDWTPYSPLGDTIIVRPLTKEETFSSGGVLLPGTAEVTRAEGVVLAVGPGIGFDVPKRILSEFHGAVVINAGFDSADIALRALKRACEPLPSEFAVGDIVFFPQWLANWQRHLDLDLEFCNIHAGQILGIYREKATV